MAGANLPAKKHSKTAPTELRLSFEGTGNGTQFIDIAQALSIINRKFYRQGVYYYVNSVEFYNDGDGHVDLHTLSDTWVTKNAWNRGFKIFQKMNGLAGNVGRPKYHDFKVFMTQRHAQGGVSMLPNTYDINAANTPHSPDEWTYSVYTSMDDNHDGTPDADEFTAHMAGGHIDQSGTGTSVRLESVGLIKSYGESRARPADAQPVVDVNAPSDPLLNLFDASSEEFINDLVENLDEHNDQTPYNNDFYGGENGRMAQQCRLVTTSSIGRVATAPGFCVPFGLICVDPDELQFGVADRYRIVLNIAAGTYHGVYAERA